MSVAPIVFEMPMEIAKGSAGRVDETNTPVALLVALTPKKRHPCRSYFSQLREERGRPLSPKPEADSVDEKIDNLVFGRLG